MSYQSIHSGPAIDAAVTALSSIETIRDQVAADKVAVAADTATTVSARNTATAAASTATARADEADSAASAASLSQEAAETAAVGADTARNEAEGARNVAQEHAAAAGESAGTAESWATVATEQAGLAVAAAFDAPAVIAARNEAVAARDVTTSARDATLGYRNQAQQALNDAAAIVYEGDASLTPTPGQIPIARATGKIDRGWLDQGIDTITAQALHRSPNAVTALCIYDTSLDSDGGAWTERCAQTSWYNEPINGRWLGAPGSEGSARAVPGAATGDYFQNPANGRFFRLNAGSGVTEVFRGNKRQFPGVAGIVYAGDGGGSAVFLVTIYDLTEPGCPMWKAYNLFLSGNVAVSGIKGLNGIVAISGSAGNVGLVTLEFARDRVLRRRSVAATMTPGLLNGAASQPVPAATLLPSTAANGLDMAVLTGSPVEPRTGLPIPTIAVATSLGVALVRPDDSVISSQSAASYGTVRLTQEALYANAGNSTNFHYALSPARLGPSFVFMSNSATTAPDLNDGVPIKLTGHGRRRHGRIGNSLQIARVDVSTFERTPAAKIAPTFNAGYLLGDIRRAYLAGAAAGAVGPTPNLIPQPVDLLDSSVWAPNGNTTLVSGSTFSGPAGLVSAVLTEPLIVGRTYFAEVQVTRISGGGDIRLTNNLVSAPFIGNLLSGSGTISGVFVALQPMVRLRATEECTWRIDSFVVREVMPDRSYKAAGADIHGSLLATAAAAGADLVGYSGWSASNYPREPYSADLDFGTAAWSVGAWVNIPADNAAAGIIAERAGASGPRIALGVNASNQLTATAYDGTTTRTVTSTTAYNIAQWVKPNAVYTPNGTLSLHVNGRQVATTTGTPLLTLNNAAAVLTIGNSYALDAPFPGSIALLKLGATVPTPEQSAWIYEQERQLFREGARCVLPDAGALVDLAYDEQTDAWIAASAANMSEWVGLVRTRVVPTAGGALLKVAGGAGGRLVARTGVGVDIDLPGGALRSELAKRGRRRDRKTVPFEFDAVAGQVRFALPVGYGVARVAVAGAGKREGATKDYVLEFDGFVETVVFAVAPGADAWVRIDGWED